MKQGDGKVNLKEDIKRFYFYFFYELLMFNCFADTEDNNELQMMNKF